MIIFPPSVIGGSPLLPVAADFTHYAIDLTDKSTYTFSGVSFGDTVKGRNKRSILAIITYGSASNIGTTVSSVTIGGVSASQIANIQTTAVNSLRRRSFYFTALVPTGTSGSVVFSDTGTLTPSISVMRLINLDATATTATASGVGSTSASMSINCPAGGVIIGYGEGGYSSPGFATSATMSPLTNVERNILTSGPEMIAWQQYASAQTGLSVTYNPLPNTNLSRVEVKGIALNALYP